MENKSFNDSTSDCFGYIYLWFFVFLGIICAKWYEGYSAILQSGIEICGDFKYEDDYFQFVELVKSGIEVHIVIFQMASTSAYERCIVAK